MVNPVVAFVRVNIFPSRSMKTIIQFLFSFHPIWNKEKIFKKSLIFVKFQGFEFTACLPMCHA